MDKKRAILRYKPQQSSTPLLSELTPQPLSAPAFFFFPPAHPSPRLRVGGGEAKACRYRGPHQWMQTGSKAKAGESGRVRANHWSCCISGGLLGGQCTVPGTCVRFCRLPFSCLHWPDVSDAPMHGSGPTSSGPELWSLAEAMAAGPLGTCFYFCVAGLSLRWC